MRTNLHTTFIVRMYTNMALGCCTRFSVITRGVSPPFRVREFGCECHILTLRNINARYKEQYGRNFDVNHKEKRLCVPNLYITHRLPRTVPNEIEMRLGPKMFWRQSVKTIDSESLPPLKLQTLASRNSSYTLCWIEDLPEKCLRPQQPGRPTRGGPSQLRRCVLHPTR